MKIDDLIREGYDLLNATTDWPTYEGGSLDRTKFVTSSEVWNCSRRIKYDKMYPSGSFPNWGYAERGNIIEKWAVECIRATMKFNPDHTLLCAGEDQRSFSDGYQSGTPDGILRYPDYTVEVLEFKSVDPRTNYSKLPKARHLAQVQQNMDLVGHTLNATVIGAQLIYIDASNLQKRVPHYITPNEVEMRQWEDKAHKIIHTPAEELPAEGIFRDECKECAHKSRCSAAVEAKKEMEAHLDAANVLSGSVFK